MLNFPSSRATLPQLLAALGYLTDDEAARADAARLTPPRPSGPAPVRLSFFPFLFSLSCSVTCFPFRVRGKVIAKDCIQKIVQARSGQIYEMLPPPARLLAAPTHTAPAPPQSSAKSAPTTKSKAKSASKRESGSGQNSARSSSGSSGSKASRRKGSRSNRHGSATSPAQADGRNNTVGFYSDSFTLAASSGASSTADVHYVPCNLIFADDKDHGDVGSPENQGNAATDAFVIDYRALNLRKELGAGSFGVVNLAMWNGSKVAVKQVRQSALQQANKSDQQVQQEFAAELRMMSKVQICVFFSLFFLFLFFFSFFFCFYLPSPTLGANFSTSK